MSPTINYQSKDICSFNRVSDWPTFGASSTQLIRSCGFDLQHTDVVDAIIYHWAELSHNGAELSKTTRSLAELSGPSCHLGRAVYDSVYRHSESRKGC